MLFEVKRRQQIQFEFNLTTILFNKNTFQTKVKMTLLENDIYSNTNL